MTHAADSHPHPEQEPAGDQRAHGHDHGHGSDGHSHGEGGHTHGGVDASILASRDALRTLWLSLVILGVTAAAQIVIVILSGSVALLSDTVHNVGDALTAIPLAAAFLLGRRGPTNRLTYGYGRAEDLAGVVVLALILFSAVYAAYEAINRLINPETPKYLLAVGLAGAIGFIGNEWVAVYRIRTGRRIGSAALVADGQHARVDGFTSLAVVAGAIGVALGFPLADPIVGLLIALVILRIVWTSGREIGLRIMDGIEPETIAAIRRESAATSGVLDVEDVQARWSGHTIRAEMRVTVASDVTVAEAATVVDAVRERLVHEIRYLADVRVEVQPAPSESSHRH